MVKTMGGAYYKEHPKTCDPEDFWGQVKRTVDGKPVSQEQIDLIVSAVRHGLEIDPDDVLLDICCGNGALTAYFFALCRGGLGVDFSDYLIDVAKKNFMKRAEEIFVLQDVFEFARNEPKPERFTKALCYGSFQYLEKPVATDLLSVLRRRFGRLGRFYIGNLPDKTRLYDYYREDHYTLGIEDSADTMIGIWRTPDEFSALAAQTGWHCDITRMPEHFYAARYRYDAILTPA